MDYGILAVAGVWELEGSHKSFGRFSLKHVTCCDCLCFNLMYSYGFMFRLHIHRIAKASTVLPPSLYRH